MRIGEGTMFGWAGGGHPGGGTGGSGRSRERGSGLPVVGYGLIELVLRESVGSGEIEGRGLIEAQLGLGRAASGGDAGRPMRQVEMEEDVLHGGGKRDERDDAHLAAADGAKEREHLVDPGQELRPEHAAGSRTRRSCQGAGWCRLLGVVRRIDGVGGRAGRRWGLRIGRRGAGLGPADRDHDGPQACVGSQDPVVPVPMDARGWHEAGQAVEQFEGRERKLVAAVHIGLGEPVDETSLRRGEGRDARGGVESLQGERPPGTVADEPLETRAILSLDADGAVDRETTGPAPGAYVRQGIGIIGAARP